MATEPQLERQKSFSLQPWYTHSHEVFKVNTTIQQVKFYDIDEKTKLKIVTLTVCIEKLGRFKVN